MYNTFALKLKAFFVHFLISAVVLSFILAIVLLFWFPGELIYAGAIDALKIIIGVDLVLGPLLTFIVFNPTKEKLKTDLVIIVLLQMGCLVAGVYVMYNERPVAQVLADDGIHLIANSELKMYEVTLPQEVSSIRPPSFLLDLPSDWTSLPALKLATELVSEKPFTMREDLYLGVSLIDKKTFDARVQNIVEHAGTFDKKNDKNDGGCVWIPVHGKYSSGSACVSYIYGIERLSQHQSFFDI